MMRHLHILLFFMMSHQIAAQYVAKGRVLDRSTKQPLAFANVGIVGKNLGTLSDLEGNFTMVMNQSNDSDSVTISMLGYQVSLIPAKAFEEEDTITILLEEAPFLLKGRCNKRKTEF